VVEFDKVNHGRIRSTQPRSKFMPNLTYLALREILTNSTELTPGEILQNLVESIPIEIWSRRPKLKLGQILLNSS